jgi:DNA-binding MarR family transcriptional regulator
VIDRLERGGLVARDASPDDLRTRRVRLTSGGRRLVRQVTGIYGEQVERALAGLRNPDQQELHRLLEKLCGHLEKLLDGTNRAAPNGGASEI